MECFYAHPLDCAIFAAVLPFVPVFYWSIVGIIALRSHEFPLLTIVSPID